MQPSKGHLSICIGLLFPYESGCMNFKIGSNVTKAVSLGGIFCISTWFCLSRFSQFILPWKWFSLFCTMVFSNQAILLFACCVCVCVSSRCCCGIPILAAAIYADTLGTGTDYDCWEWERWVHAAHEWLAEQRVISLRDSESDRQFKFEGKTVVRKRKQESFSMCNDVINQQNGSFWWHH